MQSLRFQLKGTPVEVLELIPPYVQTELGGPHQSTDPQAIPLADYIAEVMRVLDDPNRSGNEILVERVKTLRRAGANEDYERIFTASN